MKTFTTEELTAVLESHKNWLNDRSGNRANLIDANLIDANLSDAYLSGANLSGANLRDANLIDANLRGADLRGADLRGANLSDADLEGANLSDANLSDANLRGANLSDANLRGANLRGANLRGANINGEIVTKQPIAIGSLYWFVLITEGYMRIGCQRHTHEEWRGASDSTIACMDHHASEFWSRYRVMLLGICDSMKGESK